MAHLSSDVAARVATRLEIDGCAECLPVMERLLCSWPTHIPWETASRIARRRTIACEGLRPRCPESFFADHLRLGTGGTCFESNFALHALLTSLGMELTFCFCEMDKPTRHAHGALLLRTETRTFLVDAGYPIPSALPLERDRETAVDGRVYRYTAAPTDDGRWAVARHSGQFHAPAFVLDPEPVSPARFWQRLADDHGPEGLYLDEVILQKEVGGVMLRYSQSKGLIRRRPGVEERLELPLAGADGLPDALARRFGMDRSVLEVALARQGP